MVGAAFGEQDPLCTVRSRKRDLTTKTTKTTNTVVKTNAATGTGMRGEALTRQVLGTSAVGLDHRSGT